LQQLARAIASIANDVLVLIISENDDKLQLVCSRGKDLDVNINQLLKAVLPSINGKGGGNPSLAQGGGERTMPADQMMEELMKASLL
jgi:alanyl-tRNA synthetase